jgi:hypothetical protein
MDLAIRWHRLLRALAFLAGGLVFSVAIIFIFSNLAPIEVHWRIPATVGYTYDLTFKGVNTWLLAILPLLAGALIGYFYQTPARMHHVREALRHRHRVHELEHELREVRQSLDKVLMMPEDGNLALPSARLERVEAVEAVEAEPEPEPEIDGDSRLPGEEPAVGQIAASPSAKPAKVIRARRAPDPPAPIPPTAVARPRRKGRTSSNGRATAPAATRGRGRAKETPKPA